MKKISRLLFLSIFLASCVAQRTSEVPTAALTLPPTETPAPATLTPEPTENPLAGAPEGTTGKDAKGNWIKETADGTFTWSEDAQIFVMSHVIPGPIDIKGNLPLVEKSEYLAGLYASFSVQDGVVGVPNIGHLKLVLPQDAGKDINNQFLIALNKGHYKNIAPQDFLAAYNEGLNITFIDAMGKEQVMDTKQPMEIDVVRWDTASDPANNAEFIQIEGVKQFNEVPMRLAMTTKDGKVIMKIAFEDWTKVSDEQFLRSFLGPLEMIIELPVFPKATELSKGMPIGYPGDLVSAAAGKQVSQPYFEITK